MIPDFFPSYNHLHEESVGKNCLLYVVVQDGPSALELPLQLMPSSHGPAPLPFWQQNCTCQILFHTLLASFTLSFRAYLVPKYDLSTIAAGPCCFGLLLSVFNHLWFILPMLMLVEQYWALSAEEKVPRWNQHICVGRICVLAVTCCCINCAVKTGTTFEVI